MSGTSDFDIKQSRLDNPSAWVKLTHYESVRLIIDALLEAPPDYQFNKSELKRRTGLSREAIREHLPLLIELGVVREVDTEAWPEYQLNTDGKVTKELFALNSALNSVLSGESKTVDQNGPMQVPVDELDTDSDDSHDTGSTFTGVSEVDNSTRERDDDDLVDSPPSGVASINAD